MARLAHLSYANGSLAYPPPPDIVVERRHAAERKLDTTLRSVPDDELERRRRTGCRIAKAEIASRTRERNEQRSLALRYLDDARVLEDYEQGCPLAGAELDRRTASD